MRRASSRNGENEPGESVLKIVEAVRLCRRRPLLLIAIILTFAVPEETALHFLVPALPPGSFFSDPDTIKLCLEILVEPLRLASLIFALSLIREGHDPSYGECIQNGLRLWYPLLLARLEAGAYMSLGFVFCLAPGLILMLRYALLSQVVVLEEGSLLAARRRSAELTAGRQLRIAAAVALWVIPVVLVVLAAERAFGFADSPVAPVVVGCLDEILSSMTVVLMFLFYHEARDEEESAAAL